MPAGASRGKQLLVLYTKGGRAVRIAYVLLARFMAYFFLLSYSYFLILKLLLN